MPWLTYIKLAAIAVVMAGSFYVGKTLEKSTWQAKELEFHKLIAEHEKNAEKAAYDYEELRTKKSIEQREIIREVYVEISKPVYQCQLPADGLRIINKAIASANASKPIGTLPANSKR